MGDCARFAEKWTSYFEKQSWPISWQCMYGWLLEVCRKIDQSDKTERQHGPINWQDIFVCIKTNQLNRVEKGDQSALILHGWQPINLTNPMYNEPDQTNSHAQCPHSMLNMSWPITAKPLSLTTNKIALLILSVQTNQLESKCWPKWKINRKLKLGKWQIVLMSVKIVNAIWIEILP